MNMCSENDRSAQILVIFDLTFDLKANLVLIDRDMATRHSINGTTGLLIV